MGLRWEQDLAGELAAQSLFRNSACVGERVATAPGIARKHPDQLVASTSLAKRRLQLNKRSTVLPLRSCSSRAPCTRAMNSETDYKETNGFLMRRWGLSRRHSRGS